jgi:cytochrome c553
MTRIHLLVGATIAALSISAATAAAEGGFVVPEWAFPGNPAPPAAAAPPDDNTLLQVPNSSAAFTRAQVTDFFAPPDWHPDSHPPMPEVVAHGRKPFVLACGYCHLPDGTGRPENAPLAGLPDAYIKAQVADIRSRVRRSAWTGSLRTSELMQQTAEHATDGEVAAAAEYFSKLRMTRKVEVFEAARVPQTRAVRWLYVRIEDAGDEPLGQRIVEMPLDPERHELRDSSATYRAYVPVGSIARGRQIARGGGGALTVACVTCHGPDLRGVGLIPPLAGRSPSYILRQLLAFKTGARASPTGQAMPPVVAQLGVQDMIAVAAYAAAQEP